jgi:hypothetical protein
MRYLLLLLLFSFGFTANAQKNCFHLFCYDVPAGWEKEEDPSFTSYTYLDLKTLQWCRIILYIETPGKGDSVDFKGDWNDLVVKPYAVKDKSMRSTLTLKNGWKIRKGSSGFTFEGQASTATLYTFSKGDLHSSIVATTNGKNLLPVIEKFVAGVTINPDFKAPVVKEPAVNTKPAQTTSAGYVYTTTRFDDGWFAEAKADYVEVTKGDIKVLLHYADARTNMGGDPDPQINNAWNILVAPGYTSLKNYVTRSPTDYQRAHFGAGDVTDAAGRSFYVVIFSKASSGWIQIICKNKQAFVAEFGVDSDKVDWSSSSDIWNKMQNMAYYNRFAVDVTDLKGTWTSDFSGMQEYYSIYTGSHMATSIHQSSETYTFLPGMKYNWSILAINGPAGAMRYDQAKNSGNFSLPNNWQVYFSSIEGHPKTYDAYFTCIRGGRMLWMQDAKYKNGWTGYGLKK